MSFIKTPVKGMPEYLPATTEIREFIMRKIKDTYRNFGFSLIETPIIEHIENLSGKDGGENEQLIFKILKRGEKLSESASLGMDALVDSALRYDLTVPLARFYANNANKLPYPFKAMQIGPSFRADRPQKGRFRQFTQCDIDILGDDSALAEIELISATAQMLHSLNLGAFTVRINDRRLLKAMALASDMPSDKLDTVFIILDKMDKVGLEGVKEMLLAEGITETSVNTYCSFFENQDKLRNPDFLRETGVVNHMEQGTLENLEYIIKMVSTSLPETARLEFDPTLVRGMGYYTGPIFEVGLDAFHLSVAGGGRYDKMIGKYLGKSVPACGFSIGLERIVTVIIDNKISLTEQQEGIAVLIEQGVSEDKMQEALAKVKSLRQEGNRVLVAFRNNNAKFQKTQLSEFGYTKFIEFFKQTY